MQVNYKHVLWSMALGAALAIGLGFYFGEWKTSSDAKAMANKAVEDTLVAVCARDMVTDPKTREALLAKQPSDYYSVVQSSWKPVGFSAPGSYGFNGRCSEAIRVLMPKAAVK